MLLVPHGAPAKVFSFVRQNDRDKVFAVLNFSGQPQSVTCGETLYRGAYADYFGGRPAALDAATRLELKPLDYRVYVRRPGPVTGETKRPRSRARSGASSSLRCP